MSNKTDSLLTSLNSDESDLDSLIRQQKTIKNTNHEKKVFRVGIYRRVSTREQAEDGQSLYTQYMKINNYIQLDSNFLDKKLEIIDYVDEGKSAKDLKRYALQNLIKEIEANNIDFVIVVKLDRLTRRLSDLQYLINLFEKHQVTLVSINEKIDTESATGRFFITILGSLAQLEREQISERVQDVFENIVEKQPLGGVAPYGYFYLPERKKYFPYTLKYCKIYSIPSIKIEYGDELFFPGEIIPEIFQWFYSYQSFKVTANKLSELNIPTPNDIQNVLSLYLDKNENLEKNPDPLIIEKPKMWNRQSVRNILSNPFYAGIRVWNKYQNRLKTYRSPQKWIIIHDDHEELISASLFRKTHNLLNDMK